jgi:hypothetical protein
MTPRDARSDPFGRPQLVSPTSAIRLSTRRPITGSVWPTPSRSDPAALDRQVPPGGGRCNRVTATSPRCVPDTLGRRNLAPAGLLSFLRCNRSPLQRHRLQRLLH